ncbi:TetR/AcrR family transcriptional regulator [Cohnella sp. NL03-T5]|uniref:TetR/AcrR family transcriptional regulator n=1 Tax=Cohnella silvisoli TaxID=2873699 RepID=A0ABV1KP53_9BACL|nr:TetR/AcrR family transcriptional regulator [Cohnella silvisoli]MCD9020271.1 TetR/AcrR family transcriptional regulator [Cohnella silvisoli]
MKDRIAKAATHEILQRGLKFSIRDVSDRLGISTKTMYQHFESKEQLIGFIVEQSVLEMQEKEKELMGDASLSTGQKLNQALTVLPSGFAFSDIRALDELRKLYPEQWMKMDHYLTQGWDNIRLLINEGIANGELRQFDVELFIQVYIGAVYRLMDVQAVGLRGLKLEKALSDMVEFMLIGIRFVNKKEE